MGRAEQEANRRLLRARDAIDRASAAPLDIRELARIAIVSEALSCGEESRLTAA